MQAVAQVTRQPLAVTRTDGPAAGASRRLGIVAMVAAAALFASLLPSLAGAPSSYAAGPQPLPAPAPVLVEQGVAR